VVAMSKRRSAESMSLSLLLPHNEMTGTLSQLPCQWDATGKPAIFNLREAHLHKSWAQNRLVSGKS